MQPLLKKNISFPNGFFLGASVASYQVSGCYNTNWAAWETSEKRIADLSASGELEKHGMENFICVEACEHDKRYRDDFVIARTLGMNALRFGAEPAKVMPAKNIFDDAWITRYKEMVRYAKTFGITSVFNLWHWTIPLWWEKEGGWASPEAPTYFANYVERLARAFGKEVEYWITLNETNVFIGMSYRWGHWPPQVQDEAKAALVFDNLIEAHKRAYDIIKCNNPNAKVGIAESIVWNEMNEATPAQLAEKSLKDKGWNWSFLDHISDFQDFVGVNNYGRSRLGGNENKILSDMGWELYPKAIYHALAETHERYQKPVMVTENGLADAEDTRRGWFIFETLKWVHKAIKDGIPVAGYLHWSLMDNFEWAYGFWPRFGLIEIDRGNNLRRKIRPSAHFYADVCRAHALTKEIVSLHQKVIALPKEE